LGGFAINLVTSRVINFPKRYTKECHFDENEVQFRLNVPFAELQAALGSVGDQ
jgi:hypothetical protein